ncbi:peptidoglycan-binding domain-containing protein [Oceanobacillus sp. FSL K6-2867]|uniref:peptidoglycan-binding domain-containing protein n=1 Tax=Oceanobacillus sp. FSL K6-2867 TaxID=2954748 RepID=UPI0030DA823D
MKKRWLTIVPAIALGIVLAPFQFQAAEASSGESVEITEKSGSEVSEELQPLLEVAPEHQPTLMKNSAGLEVQFVQEKLNHFGLETSIDGIFGPQMKEQVIQFQKKHSLMIDGIVGKETWAALLAEDSNDMFTVEGAIDRAEEELNNDDLIFSSDGVLHQAEDGSTFYSLKVASKSLIDDGGTGTVGFYDVYDDGQVVESEPR